MSTPLIDSPSENVRSPATQVRIAEEPSFARPPTTPSGRPVERPAWPLALRIAFRFSFAYWLLYLLPFPFGTVPFTSKPAEWLRDGWDPVVRWVGAHLLHLPPIIVLPSGSGDTTYNYVQDFTRVLLAIVATVVWSVLDRRRREYRSLHDLLRTYVRYALGFIMLGYGVVKVIKTQFPYPPLDRLVEPFGEFSPMGVLWSFMGVSPAYNVFAGLGEAVGGALVFFRRTTTLGALLLVTVMSNVVILNYAYDVPVKLFSTNLLVMALFLLAPQARRLFDLLVLHRAVEPEDITSRWSVGHSRWARWAVKGTAIWFGIVMSFYGTWQLSKTYGDKAPPPPLYGIWDVQTFVRNRDTLPPILTDGTRWRRAIFGRPGALYLRFMNDSLQRWSLLADTTAHRLQLTLRDDSTRKMTLGYLRLDSNHLRLDGIVFGDTVALQLTRVDPTRFLLLSRGYHWVNERPLNR